MQVISQSTKPAVAPVVSSLEFLAFTLGQEEYGIDIQMFERTYVGSLIIGDSNKRYYEAAPGRNWMLGASAQYVF